MSFWCWDPADSRRSCTPIRVVRVDRVHSSLDGTIGFVLFNGIIGGVIAGALFISLRRLLPGGRIGGIAYGIGVLVVFRAIVDPLRAGNPDFRILGPSWVAVLVFTLTAIAFGLPVEDMAARVSTWLPLLGSGSITLLRYLLPGAIAVFAFPVDGVSFGHLCDMAGRLGQDATRRPRTQSVTIDRVDLGSVTTHTQ